MSQAAWRNPFPVPVPKGWDQNRQGIPVPGTEREGQTAVYVSSAFPSLDFTNPELPQTAYECFEFGLRTDPDANCLGARPWDSTTGDWAKHYEWQSYRDVADQRTRVGAGIMKLRDDGALGPAVEVGSKQFVVGVWAPNRPVWQIVNQATMAYSLALVSLYDTLGPNVVEYCINHSSTRVVFAQPNHIPALLKLVKSCPTLKCVVSVDSWDSLAMKGARPGVSGEAALKAWGAELGVRVLDIAEVEALGESYPRPHAPPTPEDTAMICYTSGTTGNPKGAILTHRGLSSTAVSNLYGSSWDGGSSVLFSYLPLSHIFGRFCEDVVFASGNSIGYSCGDNLRLLEDMQILKPTVMASVPRVLNRIYQSIKAATVDAPGLKGKLARKAFADKMANLKATGQRTHAVWDRIIFNKVKMALGGQVQAIGTGSAPINPEVLSFLQVALCCEVMEGYGQTENCAGAVRCLPGDLEPAGTVGPPNAGVEIKLIDVPDMEYFVTDKPHPRGEIMTRGPMVIPGYLNDPAKTKETVTEDGWLHTGDIGLIDEKGRLKIIDRIKNLVKLSQGEYVALEKIENTYGLCPLVAQIYIHGDSLEDHVVAIIVPDPVPFSALASKALGQTVSPTDSSMLLQASTHPKVLAAVAAELAPYAKQARLLNYEAINNDIYLHLDPFTAENDLLTPTFKTKRNVAAKTFEKQIKTLYAARPKKAAPKL